MGLRQHYVATGYVYAKETDSFLLIAHKKLGKWLPPGGHLLDGEEPCQGVLRELFEETGLHGQIVDLLGAPDVSTPSVEQLAAPFCLLSEPIPATSKEDAHTHIDFVYVLSIDPRDALKLSADEVSQAAWISGEQLMEINTFENVRRVCQEIRRISSQHLA